MRVGGKAVYSPNGFGGGGGGGTVAVPLSANRRPLPPGGVRSSKIVRVAWRSPASPVGENVTVITHCCWNASATPMHVWLVTENWAASGPLIGAMTETVSVDVPQLVIVTGSEVFVPTSWGSNAR